MSVESDSKDNVVVKRPLARVLYDKLKHQIKHENDPHTYWYSVREDYLTAEMASTFIQLEQDEETTQFLKGCFNKSDGLFTQIYHTLAKSLLTFVMSATSANGLLNRGGMFVISTKQFQQLLKVPEDWQFDLLLDIGAGDGKVTQKMSSFFRKVHVTEMSNIMCWRLKQLEYKVLEVNEWENSDVKYDVISCLNLLDRCDKPLTMLKQLKKRLKHDTGRLIIALVLPLKQYVEDTVDNSHDPSEIMPVSGSRIFEVQLSSLIAEVIHPSGFKLVSWSRVPYLCEGDFSRSFYSLNDLVLVLKREHCHQPQPPSSDSTSPDS